MKRRAARLPWAVLGLLAAVPAGAAPVHPWAGLGSLLVPGLGQEVQGRHGAAAGHFGLWLGTSAGSLALAREPDYLGPDDRSDENGRILYYNRTTYYAELLGSLSTNTAFYSAYDAFHGGAPEPAGQLWRAPFRPDYLTRPTTLGPLLLRAALIFSGGGSDWAVITDEDLSPYEVAAANTLRYEGVAIGEEAFFRGVVNDTTARAWGPWLGVPASALAFGLAHSGRAGTADVAGASAYGLYLGGLHVRNGYRLGEGVALHFWWNFLTAVDYLKNGKERKDSAFPVLRLQGRF
ncbi:CPBP family intramembrane glutamic endopeptidase [Thiohalorhabdus sp. Cl-TMA]|uniref:Lysostaphin resistance A-like protein n=1 Tax=Thiohalorhabdus methylotrophus TaxID=3242694 RepID=A0ABV4TU33_9GAMM